MKNTLKKIWNIVSTALVVLMVLCAVFLMGSRLLGYECYNVISHSMEPKYTVNDLLYVKEIYPLDTDAANVEEKRAEKVAKIQSMIDSGELKIGDPLTVVVDEEGTCLTHAIYGFDEENGRVIIKGLTNDTTESILYENIVGEPSFFIPKLGYISNFIQNPPGMYITIGVGIILILAVFLPDMLGKKKKEAEETDTAAVQTKIDTAAEENERLKAEIERLKAETHYSSDELAQLGSQKDKEKSD